MEKFSFLAVRSEALGFVPCDKTANANFVSCFPWNRGDFFFQIVRNVVSSSHCRTFLSCNVHLRAFFLLNADVDTVVLYALQHDSLRSTAFNETVFWFSLGKEVLRREKTLVVSTFNQRAGFLLKRDLLQHLILPTSKNCNSSIDGLNV